MQKQTHDKKLFPRLLPLITLIGCSWLVGCSTAQLPAKIALPQNHLDASGAVLGGVKSGYKLAQSCLLYTSPSPRDGLLSRMPSSA